MLIYNKNNNFKRWIRSIEKKSNLYHSWWFWRY